MDKTFATSLLGALLGLALAPATGAAAPPALEYQDVIMTRPDFDEPFQRDGRAMPPERIQQVVAGAEADRVRTLIGPPLRTGQGLRGPEWDYDLKLVLANGNFIVCQYKVVFDARNETVVETQWRRRQCSDTIAAATAQ